LIQCYSKKGNISENQPYTQTTKRVRMSPFSNVAGRHEYQVDDPDTPGSTNPSGLCHDIHKRNLSSPPPNPPKSHMKSKVEPENQE
jgi:hypothetical protein